MERPYRYQLVALGGTFDHFHAGHKAFLDFAFSIGKRLVIGIASEGMVKGKEHAFAIQPFHIRTEEVRNFISSIGRADDVSLTPLTDVYGPTRSDPEIEALIVSAQTVLNAQSINEERLRHNLSTLTIEQCPMVLDAEGKPLSSTRIRAGLIDRDGFLYASLFSRSPSLRDEVKQQLRAPFGPVIQTTDQTEFGLPLVLVGDVTTKTFVEAQCPFSLAVIDRKSRRIPFHFMIPPNYQLQKLVRTNIPGKINPGIVNGLWEATTGSTNTIFMINGEEDLLAVGLILTLPLGSTVVYGTSFGEEGMVIVSVTEEVKERLRVILESNVS